MSYAIPRTESPDRPDDAEATLEERLGETLDKLEEAEINEDDPMTDGDYVIGFLDEAWPQPTDNRR